jgi:hypothetical protein
VDINSGNPISHLRLLAGAERVPKNKLLRVSGYSPRHRDTTPTYSLNDAHAGSAN